MPDAVYADPSDRLPWLPNAAPTTPVKRPRSRAALIASAAVVSAFAVATLMLTQQREASPPPAAIQPAETVPLPAPRAVSPMEAEPEAPSAAEKAALRPEVHASSVGPAATNRVKQAAPRKRAARQARTQQSVRSTPAAPAYEPRAWQSGVRGRIIQVGAFSTSAQAQSEWKRVYYRYPLLRPLPPRVIKSNIRGRTFYRLQLGAFSQAHSELLCQRLRATGEGCIVLGLPARGKRG